MEILVRCPKKYLVFSAVEFVIIYLNDSVINKDKTIYDIKHASEFKILVLRVSEFHRVEVINTAVFLYNEASLD